MLQADIEKLKRNSSLIYGLGFCHSLMLLVPVIVPFFASKGLSLADIFSLQAAFAATIVALEAPSGYVADLFGRRNALILGSSLHGAGYLFLNWVDGFAGLLLFEVLLGAGASLLSGADLALLYDSQKALDRASAAGDASEPEHSAGIAQLGFTRSGAEALGALLGGGIALVSFDALVLVQTVFAWPCLGFALKISEPPDALLDSDSSRTETKEKLRLSMVLKHMLRGDPVLRQLVIAIPLYNLASFQVVWLAQPYWESQGIALSWFGLLWCLQSLSVALANKCGFAMEQHWGAGRALIAIAVLPILGYLGMALLGGSMGIALGMLMFIGRGLQQVILLNALNRRVPSRFRATANSFTSFLFRLAFIATGPLIGMLAESVSLQAALLAMVLYSAALAALVMAPLVFSVKGLRRQIAG